MSAGFVYILVNARMPDIIKIGASERHPQVKADELSAASGVPAPFVVAYYYGVADWAAAEALVHESLGKHRVSQDREFFAADVRVVARLIEQVAGDLGPTPHEGAVIRLNPNGQESDDEFPVQVPSRRSYVLVGGQWVPRSGDE
jgi:hypothetical protein